MRPQHYTPSQNILYGLFGGILICGVIAASPFFAMLLVVVVLLDKASVSR